MKRGVPSEETEKAEVSCRVVVSETVKKNPT
jgi:hypothetical protein